MRKALTLLTVLAVAAAMTLSVMANAPQKIKSLHTQLAQQLSVMELDGEALTTDDLESLTVTPGAELRIYLVGDDSQLFFDQNDLPIATADVSVSRLRAGQIGVEAVDGNSDEVVEAIGFGYSAKTSQLSSAAPYISISFTDQASSVEDVDFAFTLCLTVAGEAQDGASLDIAGAMTTAQLEVTAADSEIDISDGRVAVAAEDVSGVTVYLGDGVSIVTDLTEGEKYYGVARLELDDDGEAWPSGDLVVRRVYSLDTINLDGPGSGVHIDSDVTFHVYDENGAYLGTTRDLLPCCAEYYLANKKMDQLIV